MAPCGGYASLHSFRRQQCHGGPVLGAAVLTIVPESLRSLAEYRDIIYGVMLVALMAFRPDGILSYDAVKWIGSLFSKKKAVPVEGGEK